jgi:hypothetical protein
MGHCSKYALDLTPKQNNDNDNGDELLAFLFAPH